MSRLTDALAKLHRDMGQIDGETLRYQHGPSARTTVEPLEAAILAADEEREALLAALEYVVDPASGHYHACIAGQRGYPASDGQGGPNDRCSAACVKIRRAIARARGTAAEAHHGR